MNMTVRKALPSDGQVILSLVDALPRYEKLTPPDQEARKRLLIDLFSGRPRIECYVAESEGKAAGTRSCSRHIRASLLSRRFTWRIFSSCRSSVGRRRGMRSSPPWSVKPGHAGAAAWSGRYSIGMNRAINFYRRSGARHMKEWQLYRLVREDMVRILEKE